MKAHISLIAGLKFRLQTPCSFGEKSGVFIRASSTGLHTFFCSFASGGKEKAAQGETLQNAFQTPRSIS